MQRHLARRPRLSGLASIGLAVLALAGCAPASATSDAPSSAGREASPKGRPTSPLVGIARASAEAPRAGTVVERLPAGSYSYLRVAPLAPGDEAWIATVGDGAPVGAQIGIRSLGSREGFYSKRLDRTFARLDFALVSPLGTDQEIE